MRLARLAAVTSLAVVATAGFVAPANAGPIIDRAAEGLRTSPVYVDPDAEQSISAEDAERLRAEIARSGSGAMYVAILPSAARDEAGGAPEGVLQELHDRLRREGTYAVVVGNQFRAGSDVLPGGEAARLADAAFAEHASAGVAPTLLEFVRSVGDAREGRSAEADAEEAEGGGIPGGLVLLGLGAGGLGFFLWRRRQRETQENAELAEVKQEAQADLLALAEEIRELDLDVEMPNADLRAKEDYAAAVAAYERADAALDRAREPEDLEHVSSALEEGRYAMASAKARLAGLEPPERTPPCFFDPRHGPSVAEAEWAPPGGAPRPVPVCAADAQRIADGREPATREVSVGGERVPYWAAPPTYAPYAGGFYGGFGGLFPGLIIGSMLGSGFGFGSALGGGLGGDYGGDELGGGGFDLGGGDFGGDFGGGDFGGGDFGGE